MQRRVRHARRPVHTCGGGLGGRPRRCTALRHVHRCLSASASSLNLATPPRPALWKKGVDHGGPAGAAARVRGGAQRGRHSARRRGHCDRVRARLPARLCPRSRVVRARPAPAASPGKPRPPTGRATGRRLSTSSMRCAPRSLSRVSYARMSCRQLWFFIEAERLKLSSAQYVQRATEQKIQARALSLSAVPLCSPAEFILLARPVACAPACVLRRPQAVARLLAQPHQHVTQHRYLLARTVPCCCPRSSCRR